MLAQLGGFALGRLETITHKVTGGATLLQIDYEVHDQQLGHQADRDGLHGLAERDDGGDVRVRQPWSVD